jgi:hypothetical protein
VHKFLAEYYSRYSGEGVAHTEASQVKPILQKAILLVVTCGCSNDAPMPSFHDSQDPKLVILEPVANSKIKIDYNDKAKASLKIRGKVIRPSDGWVPALILVKICKDKQATNVISSIAEKPHAEADDTLTFTCDLDRPTKKGKYYVVVVAMGEEPADSGSGATKGKTRILKTEPDLVEIEVTGR